MDPELAQRRLLVVPQLIDERMAALLYHVLVLRNWRGEIKRDRQAPLADSHWGDATLDAALLVLTGAIERASGCALLPTYAYARLYFRGDALARHRDRSACQVAATIHLGGAATPICFEPDIEISQHPGDAVVYLGDGIDHWRAPCASEQFGQLFLNYVLADGARAGLCYDGRHGAFPPALTASVMAARP